MNTWRMLIISACLVTLYATRSTMGEPGHDPADPGAALHPVDDDRPPLPPPPRDRADLRRGPGERRGPSDRHWLDDRGPGEGIPGDGRPDERGPGARRWSDDRRGPGDRGPGDRGPSDFGTDDRRPGYRDRDHDRDRMHDKDRPWDRGMGRRGPGGPDDEGDGREFAPRPEELERFLEFTRENFPQVHEKLSQARENNPLAFRQMLRRVGPPMMRLMWMAKENPKEAKQLILMQKLEMQIHETRERFRDAKTDDQRDKIRTEMRGLIEQRFDARQQRLKADIDNLRQKLDEQIKRHAEQEQRKQQIVDDEASKAFEHRGPFKHGRRDATSKPDER